MNVKEDDVRKSTPLRQVANALGHLPADATWDQVDTAVRLARLPAEPTTPDTLVGVWWHSNKTGRPDVVWALVGQDGRRRTKGHPGDRPDVWRAYGQRFDDSGSPVYSTWANLAGRAARVMVLVPAEVG